MNLYFLVEGQTEAKLYPKWLTYLLPEFERVGSYKQAMQANYYIFNAGGFPSIIYKHLPNAIREVNAAGNYDYLVMCFDADEQTVSEREIEVLDCLRRKNISLDNTELVLIVQQCAIETWLLGHRALYNHAHNNKELVKYLRFYNIAQRDPERMGKPKGYDKPLQHFHYEYFIKLCHAQGVQYRKGHPTGVMEQSYFKQLEARILDTPHLPSFRHFYDFCQRVSEELRRRR